MVWRAVLPVRDEAMLAELEVTLTLEVSGQIIEWSEEQAAIESSEMEGQGDAAPAVRGDAPEAAPSAESTRIIPAFSASSREI